MSLKPGAAAEIILGLGVAALGAFILFETGNIRIAPTYAKVSPTAIPVIVGIVMLCLGLAFAWVGWRGKPAPAALVDLPQADTGPTDWTALAVIIAGLVLQIVLFERVGFVPTAALLFLCVSFAFGSRRYLRDAVVAILLAFVAYTGFVHGLGLPLPAGVLAGIY